MAHVQQIAFCKKVKELFPHFFKNKLVVDIGSLDVNGNNRYLFQDCTYLGIDIGDGDNVDIVSLGGELKLPDESVDVIISTECFEHDMYYQATLKNIYRMLKPGGLFLFSCATEGRPEHGTPKAHQDYAPLLQDYGPWVNYYKNLVEKDIREVFDIDKLFQISVFEINAESQDLYFYGLKTGEYQPRKNTFYSDCKFEAVIHKKNILIAEQEKLLIERSVLLHDILNSKAWKCIKALRYFKKFNPLFVFKLISISVRQFFKGFVKI